MALLELRDVEARYGQVRALHGVSLAVEQGQIVAVLGANGAGKTTTLRSISGTVRRSGQLHFDGKPLGRRGPEAVAKLVAFLLSEDCSYVNGQVMVIDGGQSSVYGSV